MTQTEPGAIVSSDPQNDGLIDFALGVYSDPLVRKSCLHLQDVLDVDVNLVLWGAWMASVRNIPVDATLTASATAGFSAWHRTIVKNLRKIRNLLKDDIIVGMGEHIERLRESVKKVEIDSEIIELEGLARLSREIGTAPKSAPLVCSEIELSIWTAANCGSGRQLDDSSRLAVETIARTSKEWSNGRVADNSSGKV